MRPKRLLAIVLLLLTAAVLTACNLPNEVNNQDGSGGVQTAVAQTVAAEEAQTSQPSPEEGETQAVPTATGEDQATATSAPDPTDTEEPTPTQEPSETPLPCNAAEFVTDVSIPDGKKFNPGTAFTKTWRLKNVGSCAWTSGYDLVFSGGDAMSGPSAQQLTTDPIEPGETADISVDLTAPASAGVYRGNWELRDPSGTVFGIENSSSGVFWVEIEVTEPTETPEPDDTPMVIITINPTLVLINPTVTLNHASRGMVFDGYQVRTNANNVGDSYRDGSNLGVQGFITYDLSGIPDGATILSTRLVPTGTPDTLGNPFSDLGHLRVYLDNYGDLSMNDYSPPPVLGAIVRFSSFNKMKNDTDEQSFSAAGVNAVEDALADDELQLRLQFNETETDNDGEADMVRATFQLVITYQNP